MLTEQDAPGAAVKSATLPHEHQLEQNIGETRSTLLAHLVAPIRYDLNETDTGRSGIVAGQQ